MFTIAHWKFIYVYLLGAIDTQNLMWRGVEVQEKEKIRNRSLRILIEWSVIILIFLFNLLIYLVTDLKTTNRCTYGCDREIHPLYMACLFYGLFSLWCSGLITAALLKIKNLLDTNDEINQSNTMMTIHLVIFNMFFIS